MILALPTDIRPDRKGLPVQNALAYFASSSVMKKNKFCNIETCGKFNKHSMLVTYGSSKK
jgi:hypothetical protein